MDAFTGNLSSEAAAVLASALAAAGTATGFPYQGMMPQQQLQYGSIPQVGVPSFNVGPYAFPTQFAAATNGIHQRPLDQHVHQHTVNTGRPPDLVSVPGLSDRRFEGIVASFHPDKAYGFIRCDELRQSRFPDKDIFVHVRQLGNYRMGDFVSFTVSLNRQNKPQALDLGPPGSGSPANAAANLTSGLSSADASVAGAALKAAAALLGAQTPPSGGVPAAATQSLPPPPPAAVIPTTTPQTSSVAGAVQVAPSGVEEWGFEEVDVPLELVEQLKASGGQGAQELAKRAGGDVAINFVSHEPGIAKAQIKGPKTSTSLGACLVLQRVAELL
eukprot:TRINITY_DN5871_c0_g4_i1.p1 TRINITY_DN5871_c0_g4~~TRINITY_DN5871_c0_g4_i1.p1  ORF type:complete len:330 (-),score=58.28 TRINITY_DN5871_c0_g4_i1:105-1094(-)